MGAVSSSQDRPHTSLDPRSFLEGLRNRVLRVTFGMRPGPQRLELAIEVFWYAALEVTVGGRPVPWLAYAGAEHPQRGLLVPVRLMIRSELINSGVAQPDTIVDEAMGRLLAVADEEAQAASPSPAMRETFFTWLRAAMRGLLPRDSEPVF